VRWTGVESDDGDGVRLAGLLHTGRGALSGEQVRSEDAHDVGVLLERSRDDLRSGRRLVVAVLHTEVGELVVSRDGLLEALGASVGGGDAGVDRDHEDLAALRVCFLDRVERRSATALVVARDLRDRERRVVDGGVDEDDLDARVGRSLQRSLHGLHIGRGDEDRVRLRGDDRVDERLLERRVELLRTLRGDRGTGLLGRVLDAALHGDVELVACDALDEGDLVAVGARLAAAAGARSTGTTGEHEARRGAEGENAEN